MCERVRSRVRACVCHPAHTPLPSPPIHQHLPSTPIISPSLPQDQGAPPLCHPICTTRTTPHLSHTSCLHAPSPPLFILWKSRPSPSFTAATRHPILVMANIVYSTGSRIAAETSLWVCLGRKRQIMSVEVRRCMLSVAGPIPWAEVLGWI